MTSEHPEIARLLQAQAFLLLGHRTSEPALHRRDRPHFASAQELVLDAEAIDDGGGLAIGDRAWLSHAVALTRCLPYGGLSCDLGPDN